MDSHYNIRAVEYLSILGSTGSIGCQTLDIVRANRDRYVALALVAGGGNLTRLAEQIIEFTPEYVAVPQDADAVALRKLLAERHFNQKATTIESGPESVDNAATLTKVTTVVAAIVGFACLTPVLAALRSGKDVALCNKECLVAAGPLVRAALAQSRSRVIPVDSEHSSIFQCLLGEHQETSAVERIILTASGGPFFGKSRDELRAITPAQAVKHPRWSMGAKISVDSATLMNKGLEVIEAHWLFDLPAEKIDVLIHPQSAVHGFVEFTDRSVLACLFHPDMKLPIGFALEFLRNGGRPGARLKSNLVEALKLSGQSFQFFEPDLEVFPALALCYDTLRSGGLLPAVLNSANEVAVHSFLSNKLPFLSIAEVVARVVSSYSNRRADNIEDVFEADVFGRENARKLITSDFKGRASL